MATIRKGKVWKRFTISNDLVSVITDQAEYILTRHNEKWITVRNDLTVVSQNTSLPDAFRAIRESEAN